MARLALLPPPLPLQIDFVADQLGQTAETVKEKLGSLAPSSKEEAPKGEAEEKPVAKEGEVAKEAAFLGGELKVRHLILGWHGRGCGGRRCGVGMCGVVHGASAVRQVGVVAVQYGAALLPGCGAVLPAVVHGSRDTEIAPLLFVCPCFTSPCGGSTIATAPLTPVLTLCRWQVPEVISKEAEGINQKVRKDMANRGSQSCN
jgi:hypothetical protein